MTSDTLLTLPFNLGCEGSSRPISSFDFICAPWERDCACDYPCSGMQSDQDKPFDSTNIPVVAAQSDDDPSVALAALGNIAVDSPPHVTDPSETVQGSTLYVATQSIFPRPSQAQHPQHFTAHAGTSAMPIQPGHPPGEPLDASAYHQQVQGQGYYAHAGSSAQGSGASAAAGSSIAQEQPRPNPGRAHRYCHACHRINHVRRKKCVYCSAPKTVVKGSSWRPRVERQRREAGAVSVMRPVLPAVGQRAGASSSSAGTSSYHAAQAEATTPTPPGPAAPASAQQQHDQTQEWEAAIDDALAGRSKDEEDEECEDY